MYGDEGCVSNYWFLHSASPQHVLPKDLLTASLNNNLKQFPTDSKPGYLAVAMEAENILEFGMFEREKVPYRTPYTYKDENGNYTTYFTGFYYRTESGIYVSKLECVIYDEDNQDTELNLQEVGSETSSKLLELVFSADAPSEFTEDSFQSV
jgi:hypothetical protein